MALHSGDEPRMEGDTVEFTLRSHEAAVEADPATTRLDLRRLNRAGKKLRVRNRRERWIAGLTGATLVAAAAVIMVQKGDSSDEVTLASGIKTLRCQSGQPIVKPGANRVELACRSQVQALADVTSFSSQSTTTGRTGLPAGTEVGMLLVVTAQTTVTGDIAMEGWTRAYDQRNNGQRALAWWTVVKDGQAEPMLKLPGTGALAMQTRAFTGTDPAVKPVAIAANGVSVPSQKVAEGGLMLLSVGYKGTATPAAPSGKLLELTPSAKDLTLASAVFAGKDVKPGWTGLEKIESADAVSSALVLRPAGNTSPTTKIDLANQDGKVDELANDKSTKVKCKDGTLDYKVNDGDGGIRVACRPTGQGIRTVGGPKTFVSASSANPRTALPDGVQVGDLLVTTLTTTENTKVSLPEGWQVIAAQKSNGTQMITVWHWMSEGLSSASATLEDASEVSMVTVAMRNVNPDKPIGDTESAAGASSPAVAVKEAGSALMLVHGGTDWQSKPGGPKDAQVLANVDNGDNVGSAIAVGAAPSGSNPELSWTNSSKSSISTSLVLRPVKPGTLPAAPVVWDQDGADDANDSAAGKPKPGSGPANAGGVNVPGGGGTGPVPSTANPVCGSGSLNGPDAAPAGAVVVKPGQDLGDITKSKPAGTTFWLAPGKHTLGNGEFDQVEPKEGDKFIGAPGAILDGQRQNKYAFVGQAKNVTISYLTIQNFGQVGGNNNEGVVNHDAGPGWTLLNNTIQTNAGAGAMIGNNNKLIGNCLRRNGQYGFNAYRPDGVHSVVMDRNEIAENNADDWEAKQNGCGCTGGGKFWATQGASVTNNWVHHNKSVGLWADTNNVGFLFKDNTITDNEAEGLFYETSYNAAILDNYFARNAWKKGPTNPGFPTGAIYLSESGSDPRISGDFSKSLRISGNTFENDWSAVVLWENSDRFAGSPANTSTGHTTLVNKGATVQLCGNASQIKQTPYLEDCRWRTRNVVVENNKFILNRSKIPGCSANTACGYNALFSNFGTYPDWSPYKENLIPELVTFKSGNVFRNNNYQGDWGFVAKTSGVKLSYKQWRGEPYNQDEGSSAG